MDSTQSGSPTEATRQNPDIECDRSAPETLSVSQNSAHSSNSGSFCGFEDGQILHNEVDIEFSLHYYYFTNVSFDEKCFDTNYLIIYHIFSQENGDRNYRLENGDVRLRSSTVKLLKWWDLTYPTILYDSKYLKRLAIDVFGMDCLARSTVFGTRHGQNPSAHHRALDGTKLNFIRGNYFCYVQTIKRNR